MNRFVIVWVVCMLPPFAASAATPAMPPEVAAHIEGMKKYCRDAGGEPIKLEDSSWSALT